MGKPWKRRERERFVSPDAPVDYKWSSQSYTLKEILTNFKLPVVVQCREDTFAEHVQNFFFELRQPVMLHNKRSIRKVFARCIRKGDGGTIKELLPEVVIPEDYAGWFKISKGLNFDKPSPHKTIHSLTLSNAEFFLCTTNIDAIVLPDDGHTDFEDDDVDAYADFTLTIHEGDVLRKTGIQKINQMMLPEVLRSNSVDNRYLMCIDDKDNELFIPLGQEGLFYEVSDGNLNKNDNSILQVPDILDEIVDLPLYVRHILGDPPPISKFYSPCLKLVRIKEEETVMGATLEKGEEIIPLEIQTNSPIKFEIALNTPMLQSSLEYIEAVDLCDTVSQSYLKDMKLAVNFKVSDADDDVKESRGHFNPMFEPETTEVPESVCNSQRTSSTGMSECGETEANSEFSIHWNPADQSTTSFRFANECTETDTDCLSIESINIENVDRFNGILGGNYVQGSNARHNLDDGVVVREMCGSDSDVDGTLKKERQGDVVIRSSDGVVITPYVDTTEAVTDFSVRSSHGNYGPEQVYQHSEQFDHDLQMFDPLSGPETESTEQYSDRMTTLDEFASPRSVLTPPSPFKTIQTSMSSSLNSIPRAVLSNSSKNSSTLTISSGGGSKIDLKDHFPSMTSSSGTGSCESVTSNREPVVPRLDLASTNEYTFTGDVFIMHDERDTFEDEPWGDKFKVVKSKDMRSHGSRKKKTVLVKRPNGRSLSDNLINFEDFNRANNVPGNGIITCQVADEMMSSYNDLRLSLEEVTKSAKQNHIEDRWNDFCLERSCSLPVRSRQVDKKETTPTEEYSQSWEQISPRRGDDVTVVSGNSSSRGQTSSRGHSSSRSQGMTSKTLNNLNTLFDANCEDARLISDTSSEESGQLSHRSFTSEGSESVRDLFTNYLPRSQMNDRYSDTDASVQKGHTITRDKSKLAQRIKVKKEIQRKKTSDWNDVVYVI